MELHKDRSGALAAPVTGTIYEGTVARVHPDGDPLRYGPDHVEYRDAAGLQEICNDLQTPRPFTLLHPDSLISAGARADIIGQVIGARLDGDFVIARILVTDPRGVAAIDAGMHELSLGYLAALDDNRRQRNIRVDHLALVPKGRCLTCALRADCQSEAACPCTNRAISYNAEVAESNLDAPLTAKTRHELPSSMFAAPGTDSLPLEDEGHVRAAMSRYDQTQFKGPAEKKAAYHHIVARAHQLGIDPAGFEKKYGNMDQGISMDELSKKLGEALADVAAQKARADALDSDLKAVKAELATAKTALVTAEVTATNAQASVGAEKSRADAAEATVKTAVDKAKLDADAGLTLAVRNRVAIETQANRILGATDATGKGIDRSGLSDRDIKVAIVKHVDSLEIGADKVPAFVDGVYEGAIVRASNAAVSVKDVRETILANKQDGTKLSGSAAEAAARKDMMDRKRTGKA